MYLKIAYALLGRSCWQEMDDVYRFLKVAGIILLPANFFFHIRKSELDELLNSWLESNDISDEVTIDYMNRFINLQVD